MEPSHVRQPTEFGFGTDPQTLSRLFGPAEDLLAMWVAEPDLEVASVVTEALVERAGVGWFGYEGRTSTMADAFVGWMERRHGWRVRPEDLIESPSVGTSIGVLLEIFAAPRDAVLMQTPVFTDFKTLIGDGGLRPVKNALVLDGQRYAMDVDHLASLASDPATSTLLLCNPHNPVGRVWTRAELIDVARICAANGVAVISDEIHADVVLGDATFTPFATVAAETGVRFASLHGPIKTFGLAGLCDTVVVTGDADVHARFRARSSQLHLTRNNVFSLAAWEAAYRHGDSWVDGLLGLVERNADVLDDVLPDGVRLVRPEGTYLAWLDLRDLEMDAPDLATWLWSSARLALSPGHWFGREGAGFARMTIAAPTARVEEAARRLTTALSSR